MKILILNWRCPKNPLSGGAEKVTLEHAKAWVKQGWQVTWFAGNYPTGHKQETIDGINIYRYANPILIYLIAPFIYWLKFRGNVDLVIDEFHGIPFLTPLWAWKSKKLAYIHEVAQEIWDEMLPFPINILGKIYEKVYFFFYKNIPFLTGSQSTKNDLVKFGVKEKNITIIPHGLFLKPISQIPKKEKTLTLLYVSRLVKMKGIEDALKIFTQVYQKIPNAKFWIVGTGEEKYIKKLHTFTNIYKISNSVTFFGYVDEKKKIELYQRVHFLIHTSVREGFGLVVIEANSQGTPAIVYENPGLRDLVINNVNGYKFQKNNYDWISDYLISLFTNQKKYFALSLSSIRYAKQYNWSKITTMSIQLINHVVKSEKSKV